MWPPSVEIIHWIAESKRPFQIVNDHGFQLLMKTGRPGYQIPSAKTVAHNMQEVFDKVHTYCQDATGNVSITSEELIRYLPCQGTPSLSYPLYETRQSWLRSHSDLHPNSLHPPTQMSLL